MKCVVSCGSTSFPSLVFFFGALLWGYMIHMHTGRWMWQGSASVVSWSWEKYFCQSKLQWKRGATARYYAFHTRTVLPRGSPCQDPAGNRTTWWPQDHLKETQTAVVWTCLPFIRSGQNHLARHSERGKKTRQSEKEVGRQHQGMDRLGVRKVPEGSGEQGKVEETGCKIICVAPVPLVLKG